jgi:vacuolar-type H+-ATPase subunit I/STV1
MSEKTLELPVQFVDRVFHYPIIHGICEQLCSIYRYAKGYNPSVKVGLEKVESSLTYVQPIVTKIEQQPIVKTIDQFGCRQLDKVELGLEKTKNFIDHDVLDNVKSSTTKLASSGKNILIEKKSTLEKYPIVSQILTFIIAKFYYVHEQIESNPKFTFAKPIYDKILGMCTMLSLNFKDEKRISEDTSGKKKERKKTRQAS